MKSWKFVETITCIERKGRRGEEGMKAVGGCAEPPREGGGSAGAHGRTGRSHCWLLQTPPPLRAVANPARAAPSLRAGRFRQRVGVGEVGGRRGRGEEEAQARRLRVEPLAAGKRRRRVTGDTAPGKWRAGRAGTAQPRPIRGKAVRAAVSSAARAGPRLYDGEGGRGREGRGGKEAGEAAARARASRAPGKRRAGGAGRRRPAVVLPEALLVAVRVAQRPAGGLSRVTDSDQEPAPRACHCGKDV